MNLTNLKNTRISLLSLSVSIMSYGFSQGNNSNTVRNPQLPLFVPSDSLVAWWNFDGDYNDKSGNGNHLIMHNSKGPVDKNTHQRGIQYNHYTQRESEWLQCKELTQFKQGTQQFSIAISFAFNSLGQKNIIPIIFMGYNHSGRLHIGPMSLNLVRTWSPRENKYEKTKLQLYFGNETLIVDCPINSDKWYDVLLTFDGSQNHFSSKFNCYINGVYVPFLLEEIDLSVVDNYKSIWQPSKPPNYNGSGNDLVLLGTDYAGYNTSFYYDDIGIWNRVISDEEKLLLFNQSVTTNMESRLEHSDCYGPSARSKHLYPVFDSTKQKYGYKTTFSNSSTWFIKPKFDKAFPFYNSRNGNNPLAVAKRKGKWFMIDKQGKTVKKLPYQDISPNYQTSGYLYEINGKYGILSFKGIDLTSPENRFTEIWTFEGYHQDLYVNEPQYGVHNLKPLTYPWAFSGSFICKINEKYHFAVYTQNGNRYKESEEAFVIMSDEFDRIYDPNGVFNFNENKNFTEIWGTCKNYYTSKYLFNSTDYLIVTKNGKFGLLDLSIPFTSFQSFRDGYRDSLIKSPDKIYNPNQINNYSLLKNYNYSKSIIYDSICPTDLLNCFSLRVMNNKKYGLISNITRPTVSFKHNFGEEIISTTFEYICEFDNPYHCIDYKRKNFYDNPQNVQMSAFKMDNKWGVVNSIGQIIIKNEYDSIVFLSNEIITVIKNGKFGFYSNKIHKFSNLIDTDTIQTWKYIKLCEPIFDSFHMEHNYIIRVFANGHTGMIDANCYRKSLYPIIVPPIFESIVELKSFVYVVKRDDKYAIIYNGKLVDELGWCDDIVTEKLFTHDNNDILFINNNGKWGFVEAETTFSRFYVVNPVFDTIYPNLKYTINHIGYFVVVQNGKYGTLCLSDRNYYYDSDDYWSRPHWKHNDHVWPVSIKPKFLKITELDREIDTRIVKVKEAERLAVEKLKEEEEERREAERLAVEKRAETERLAEVERLKSEKRARELAIEKSKKLFIQRIQDNLFSFRCYCCNQQFNLTTGFFGENCKSIQEELENMAFSLSIGATTTANYLLDMMLGKSVGSVYEKKYCSRRCCLCY